MPLWVDCFFTLTLDERGNLRPFLQSWRGKPFTAEELKGFNVAVLVGVDALVQVSHAVKGDRTYANIDSAMRLPPGMESPGDLDGYVRVKDRAPEEAARESYNDDTLPF